MAILRVLAMLAAACSLTACLFSENYGTDGMWIFNETAAPIEVFYRRPMGTTEEIHEDFVNEIGVNQGILVIGLHQTEGPCLLGMLVAVQDAREIATLSQPCEGVEWVIRPGGS